MKDLGHRKYQAEDIAGAKTDQATFEIRSPPAAGIVCPSHLRQGGFQLSSFVPFRRDAKCPTTRGPNVVPRKRSQQN